MATTNERVIHRSGFYYTSFSLETVYLKAGYCVTGVYHVSKGFHFLGQKKKNWTWKFKLICVFIVSVDKRRYGGWVSEAEDKESRLVLWWLTKVEVFLKLQRLCKSEVCHHFFALFGLTQPLRWQMTDDRPTHFALSESDTILDCLLLCQTHLLCAVSDRIIVVHSTVLLLIFAV